MHQSQVPSGRTVIGSEPLPGVASQLSFHVCIAARAVVPAGTSVISLSPSQPTPPRLGTLETPLRSKQILSARTVRMDVARTRVATIAENRSRYVCMVESPLVGAKGAPRARRLP